MVSRAVVYIASGEQYINEAMRSINSLKVKLGDRVLILSPDNARHGCCLSPRQHKLWYLDAVQYYNDLICYHLLNVNQFLLLDTDTYICGDIEPFFTILDKFDIAATQAIGRETMYYNPDIPASFPEYHIGAISFNNNNAVKKLFANWLVEYEQNQDKYGNNDQGPLRTVLYNSDIRIATLPPEFCFRYRWGGLISGQVRILHGREHNTPYEEIAKSVNSQKGIRVWHRRELA